MSYILKRLVGSCTLLCVYRAAEHTEQQSNRAVCSRAACRSHDPCSVVTCQLAYGRRRRLRSQRSRPSGRHHSAPRRSEFTELNLHYHILTRSRYNIAAAAHFASRQISNSQDHSHRLPVHQVMDEKEQRRQ
jgi:hypothetical protein